MTTKKQRNWNDPPRKRDWTPVLHDGVYCSPACGGGKGICDKSKYDAAVKKSNALAKQLGSGWKPYVWENLGWFWNVQKGVMAIHPSVGYYTAYLNASPQFIAIDKTAKGAVKKAITALDECIDQLQVERKRIV